MTNRAFMTFDGLANFMAVGYVLINVTPGQEYQAYQEIKTLPNIVDTTLLFGDYDIIVKLEASSLGIIAKTVVETIRQVEGVTDTKTLAGAEL
jgi:DNA-binding Lrp family transcriptional regulator